MACGGVNRHSTVSSIDRSGDVLDDDCEDIVIDNDYTDGTSGFLDDTEGELI